MTADEALAIAREVARERGWTWIGPGHARKGGWLEWLIRGGKSVWKVYSHSGRGAKVVVAIDDSTGVVIAQHFEPR